METSILGCLPFLAARSRWILVYWRVTFRFIKKQYTYSFSWCKWSMPRAVCSAIRSWRETLQNNKEKEWQKGEKKRNETERNQTKRNETERQKRYLIFCEWLCSNLCKLPFSQYSLQLVNVRWRKSNLGSTFSVCLSRDVTWCHVFAVLLVWVHVMSCHVLSSQVRKQWGYVTMHRGCGSLVIPKNSTTCCDGRMELQP